MRKIVIFESIVIFILLILTGYLYQKSKLKNSTNCANIKELNNTDLYILSGCNEEYYKINNNIYCHDSISIRDYAIYSYIMAEKYNDPFAAQQFADCILMNESLNKNKAWISVVFPYLKYAADTLLQDAPLSSYSAAFEMAKLCSGYADFMPMDSAKYIYYKKKAAIALSAYYE